LTSLQNKKTNKKTKGEREKEHGFMFLPKIKINLKGVIGALALFYPLAVFLSFVVFDVKPNHLSVFIVLFAILYFVMVLTQTERKKPMMFISPALLFLIGLTGLSLDMPFVQQLFPNLAGKTEDVIKFYPVLANTAYFILFWTTLIFPPTLVYDIVLLFDKRAKDDAVKEPMEIFCRRATKAWCVFFVIDTVLAAVTIFIYPSDTEKARAIWAIYNGAITYIIMCAIFLIQLIRGKRLIKKSGAFHPSPR
jgi:uncharacterized membrane protein